MSNLRCWSLLSVLLSVLAVSSVTVTGDELSITEIETLDEPADMLDFAGTKHLVIPNFGYDGSHPITVEAIVVGLYSGSIMGDFNGSGLGLDVANGYVAFHVNDGRSSDNGYAWIRSKTSIGRDKAVHVAGVLDGHEMRLFVDGKLEGRLEIGEFNPSIHPFMVGADPGGQSEPTKRLIGIIDKVRVSKTPRYTKDFRPPTKFVSDEHSLVLYRFGDRDGNFVADASGKQRHGKIRHLGEVTAENQQDVVAELKKRLELLEKEVESLKARLQAVEEAAHPHQREINRLRALGALVVLKDGNIVRINLTDSAISNDELELLSSLSTLENLTLNGCRNLTDAGLVHLSPLTGLKALALERTQITDAGLEHLKGLRELGLLSLNWSPVGENGLKPLENMNKLGVLYLCATRTSDSGVASLKNMKQLSWLDLRETQVTDKGLRHLSGLSQLRLLSLYGIPMTDAGIGPLSELENLVQLTLNNTQVTDAGLLPLTKLPKLNELNLGGTQVTEKGVKRVQRKLPKCRISLER